MPPKVQFSREQIVDTAFNIARESGIASLTVRKVAARLGCSVAPIYVNFNKSDDLIDAVMDKIKQLSWEYSTGSYTDIGFFNIGIGQLLFVRDNPRLFLELVNSDYICSDMEKDVEQQMVDIMMKDRMLDGLSREDNRKLLLQMSIFTNGLSLELLKENSRLSLEGALSILEETAHQLIHSFKTDFRSSFTPYSPINIPK
ncbi:TetR/AcrR family transcriptional regulator [Spirochaeta isovalerica]|uniref:AcrR family transcriptional regulator n=1 Tax=Spirochaeta isovalerica TaxID=150 RepID=A0A841R898_9SPIO|nr:TetR family transcriptional regulator [Spirochaeta isovalerica]MBB6479417.1 AcrR family transcriptional regulator [Spirochaeta isovalerica]